MRLRILCRLGLLRQLDKKKPPGGYLHPGQNKRQDEAYLGPGYDTGGRIPVPHHQIDDDGSSNDRKPVKYAGNRHQQQGDGIIAGSVIFEIFEISFDSAMFQAARTQMLIVQRKITQGAKEPAADGARHHGLFPGMVKTAGLFVQLNRCACLACRQRPRERRVNIRPYPAAASAAYNQGARVDSPASKRCIAIGAVKQKIFLYS